MKYVKVFQQLGFSTDGTFDSVMKLDCEKLQAYIQDCILALQHTQSEQLQQMSQVDNNGLDGDMQYSYGPETVFEATGTGGGALKLNPNGTLNGGRNSNNVLGAKGANIFQASDNSRVQKRSIDTTQSRGEVPKKVKSDFIAQKQYNQSNKIVLPDKFGSTKTKPKASSPRTQSEQYNGNQGSNQGSYQGPNQGPNQGPYREPYQGLSQGPNQGFNQFNNGPNQERMGPSQNQGQDHPMNQRLLGHVNEEPSAVGNKRPVENKNNLFSHRSAVPVQQKASSVTEGRIAIMAAKVRSSLGGGSSPRDTSLGGRDGPPVTGDGSARPTTFGGSLLWQRNQEKLVLEYQESQRRLQQVVIPHQPGRQSYQPGSHRNDEPQQKQNQQPQQQQQPRQQQQQAYNHQQPPQQQPQQHQPQQYQQQQQQSQRDQEYRPQTLEHEKQEKEAAIHKQHLDQERIQQQQYKEAVMKQDRQQQQQSQQQLQLQQSQQQQQQQPSQNQYQQQPVAQSYANQQYIAPQSQQYPPHAQAQATQQQYPLTAQAGQQQYPAQVPQQGYSQAIPAVTAAPIQNPYNQAAYPQATYPQESYPPQQYYPGSY